VFQIKPKIAPFDAILIQNATLGSLFYCLLIPK
jgi:hypothetical protein